jgi:cysteinyl-tRNA synthetase
MSGHGYTYETEDGVYYDTAKFAEYPDFARLDLSGLKAGARVEYSDEKINPSDFAVWKFIKPGEKHAMRLDYLGRPGYPGWHLECSTIIHEELGEPIDIHAGGIDHIPVHHTNEIAETYAAYGQPLSRFWLHANFITIDGEKISKSLSNVYLFTDLAERGFDELDYKMWVLSGHYQGTRNFTYDSLAAAKARRLNWRSRIALLYQATASEDTTEASNDSSSSQDSDFYSRILAAVNNNLNSPEAFAIIDNADLSLSDWQKIDDLFGLNLIASTPDITGEAKNLIRERQSAREQKDYALSDSLRDQLAQMNIKVNDTPTGPIWEYIS